MAKDEEEPKVEPEKLKETPKRVPKKPTLSSVEIEHRYQAHLEKIRRGGK